MFCPGAEGGSSTATCEDDARVVVVRRTGRLDVGHAVRGDPAGDGAGREVDLEGQRAAGGRREVALVVVTAERERLVARVVVVPDLDRHRDRARAEVDAFLLELPVRRDVVVVLELTLVRRPLGAVDRGDGVEVGVAGLLEGVERVDLRDRHPYVDRQRLRRCRRQRHQAGDADGHRREHHHPRTTRASEPPTSGRRLHARHRGHDATSEEPRPGVDPMGVMRVADAPAPEASLFPSRANRPNE